MRALNAIVILGAFLNLNVAVADWAQLDWQQFSMNPPPVAGSNEDKQDIAQILQLQKSRTQDQCELARSQEAPTFDALFANANFLNEAEAGQAKEIVKKMLSATSKVSSTFKKQFQRERPYDRDEKIKPCIRKTGGNTSYPSSHATMGVTGACVLSDLFPAKAKEIEEYGTFVGDLRVIGGVHHPSDVRAGQDLGKQICDKVRSEQSYQDEVNSLKH